MDIQLKRGLLDVCVLAAIRSEDSYGYKTCKSLQEFQYGITDLYYKNLMPAIRNKGLCATIYTQVSDVEDEINGLVTYDRKVVKPDQTLMREMAEWLQKLVNEE